MGMRKFLQGLSVLFTVCIYTFITYIHIWSLEVLPVEPGTVQGTCIVPLRHKLPLLAHMLESLGRLLEVL